MTEEKSNEPVDEGMTPDERLAWLRERGVKVTTPEERRAGQVVNALKTADQCTGTDEDQQATVTYVLVPADTSKEIQELTFQRESSDATAATSGDLLVDHLKPAFSSRSDQVDLSLLHQQPSTQAILGSDGAAPTVSDATLRQVAAEAHVETVQLVAPVPSNGYTAINIYLDEIGMMKRLPLNTRASQYAARAGFNPPPQFYGDVFLGRVRSKPVLKNLSFSAGPDTSPDAPWLLAATNQNLEHQMEMNRLTGQPDAQQPAIAGGDGVAKQEEGYSWTQTEQEIELVVPLDADDARSKDVTIRFLPQSISVSFRKESLLVLPLFENVDVDGCTWTIDDTEDKKGRKLVVTMEKVEEALWPRIRD